jgi:hypothetical protein
VRTIEVALVASGSTCFIVVFEVECASRFEQAAAAGEQVGLGLDVQHREDGHHTIEALSPRRVLRQTFVPHLFGTDTIVKVMHVNGLFLFSVSTTHTVDMGDTYMKEVALHKPYVVAVPQLGERGDLAGGGAHVLLQLHCSVVR